MDRPQVEVAMTGGVANVTLEFTVTMGQPEESGFVAIDDVVLAEGSCQTDDGGEFKGAFA